MLEGSHVRASATALRNRDEHALTRRAAHRRRMERAHRVARADAAEVGELMDVVNHELRTPLTTVLGFTELLASGDAGELTAEQAGLLERVASGAEQLQCLVEALLRTTHDELAGGAGADVADVLRRVLGSRAPGACCA